MADRGEERVPQPARPRFGAVVALPDRFRAEHRDGEYAPRAWGPAPAEGASRRTDERE
ncbi:MAG TPA: hypothetical protein VG370_32735 [Chloroflexota bacterium]|jgi:hypothetical protein|nr:hypothetical protein [Chloroflexota bacterium]